MKKTIPEFYQVLIIIIAVAGILIFALSGYLNTIIRPSLSPIIEVQKWLNLRYIAIYDLITFPRDVNSLRQQNAQLESEIADLETQVIQLQQQLREADVLYALLDFARARPEDIYVAAAVVGIDPSPFLHYVIIDHGSDDGIRHGMPVVTEKGLVGRIESVTANAARVQLITDPSSTVNIMFQEFDIQAVLMGSITGDISVEMITQEATFQGGELILTSGLGGNYPADIVVGQVVGVRKIETGIFQSASLQPAVDFTNLRAVLIITNFQPTDISPLIPTQSP